MFPKMCLFKTEFGNPGKLKKSYKFLNNCAGIDPKHPNIPKQLEAPERVPRETDSSPFRVFQWFLRPSTSISRAPRRLGCVKSWLFDKEIGMSLNIMISALVPTMSITRFFCFLAAIEKGCSFETAVWLF